MAAYQQVTLNRIADPTVPEGCLLTVSAMQFPALDAEEQTVLSRAGFSSEDLAIVAAVAARIPGRPQLP